MVKNLVMLKLISPNELSCGGVTEQVVKHWEQPLESANKGAIANIVVAVTTG